jgi:signal transduction histidine kinase
MLNPIQEIIKKIDRIKASQLNERLAAGNQNDEFSQLSDRFNQMLDRLEKAFKAQKAFVSNASHELRTPLTSITGQIQVSLLANDDPEDLRKMIQSVLEDVKQLNRLSNNLLDLSSLDNGNPKQEFTLINVLDKISRVRSEVIKKNPESTILINFEVKEEEIPELMGNPHLLYTTFFNLLDNGIKYSPYKTVNVNVINQDDSILVEITNKCIITKSDDLRDFFEPFKRGLNSRHIYGHGVGLSLVKGIIELHSGTITVELVEAGLISFKVLLPKKI